jgi:predicted small integral membrane protein
MNQNFWRDRVLSLRVFGIAWTVIHVFYGLISEVLIIILVPPVIVGAVSFLYGAFALKSRGVDERVFRRAHRAIIAGLAVWFVTDIWLFVLSGAFRSPAAP